jgi:hypothetical protein
VKQTTTSSGLSGVDAILAGRRLEMFRQQRPTSSDSSSSGGNNGTRPAIVPRMNMPTRTFYSDPTPTPRQTSLSNGGYPLLFSHSSYNGGGGGGMTARNNVNPFGGVFNNHNPFLAARAQGGVQSGMPFSASSNSVSSMNSMSRDDYYDDSDEECETFVKRRRLVL